MLLQNETRQPFIVIFCVPLFHPANYTKPRGRPGGKRCAGNCHPMFGSVAGWITKGVLGINVCEDAVGCDKVRIEPHAIPGVTFASGWLDTPKGRISVSWRLEDGKMTVEKDVPAGVTVVNDGRARP